MSEAPPNTSGLASRQGPGGSLWPLLLAVAWLASCGLSDSTIDLFEPTPDPGPNACTADDKCIYGCSADLGCVQCLTAADCSVDEPHCVLGECRPCLGASDCEPDQACFPAHHDCDIACSSDDDCGGGEPLCDLATGACIGCREEADCGGNKPACEPNRAQCSECASAVDCPPERPACDLQDGKCRVCLIDAHCTDPTAPRCVEHGCAEL